MSRALSDLLNKYDPEPVAAQAPEAKKTNLTSLLDKYDPPQPEPAPVQEESSFSGRRLLKSTAESLPMAGTLFGGGFGALAGGPLGGLAGAGLGKGAGESAKGLILSMMEDPEAPQTRAEVYGNPAKAIVEGATEQATGDIAGKAITGGLGLINKSMGRVQGVPKGNVDDILGAGDRLNVAPTRSMVMQNPEIAALESGLSQQPTFAGRKVARGVEAVQKQTGRAAEGLLAERGGMSPFEVGEEFKKGLTQKVGEGVGPLRMSYDNLASDFANMPIAPKALDRASKMLSKSEFGTFPNTKAGGVIKQYAESLPMAKTVNDLRTLETSAKAAMRAETDYQAKQALGQVVKATQRAQQRHILQSAIDSAPTPKIGKQVAGDIVTQLKETNKGYRSFMKVLEEISGPNKLGKTADQFLDSVEAIPSEKIADRFFTTNNVKYLQDVKTNLPEQFELLKKAKLGDIAEKASIKGEVSPSRLVSNLKGMGKEAREMIFGSDGDQVLKDLETFSNAYPEKLGPSGTPKGSAWMSFNPLNIGDEARSALQYMVYQGKVPELATPGLLKAVGRTGTAGLLNKKEK